MSTTMKIGDKTQAQNVTGRNLQEFTEVEDIQWALGVHILSRRPDLSTDEVKAVLMTGNEDAPDQIWIARETPVLITTEVELVGGNDAAS